MTQPPYAGAAGNYSTPPDTEATTAQTATTGLGLTNEDLDAMVAVWHDLPDDHPDAELPLNDFLGMTMDEYMVWTKTGQIPPHLAETTPEGVH